MSQLFYHILLPTFLHPSGLLSDDSLKHYFYPFLSDVPVILIISSLCLLLYQNLYKGPVFPVISNSPVSMSHKFSQYSFFSTHYILSYHFPCLISFGLYTSLFYHFRL